MNGATLTSDRFGNSGRAYNFNGLNNYIQTSTVGPTGNLSRTISVWYNTSQLFTMIPDPGYQNEQMTFVSYGTQASAGMFDCSINHNCEGVTLDVFNSVYTRTAITSDSVWHNLVYVFNSTTGNLNNDVNIFKDGQLISASNCLIGQSLILNTGTANPITIGAYINRQIRFFKGQLDDICIWNRALDSTEISQLYQTQSSDVSNGNIGVNVIAPQRNLHVKDVIRLEPRSTAPDNPVKGDIYFDGLLNKLRVYDGTSWQNCW